MFEILIYYFSIPDSLSFIAIPKNIHPIIWAANNILKNNLPSLIKEGIKTFFFIEDISWYFFKITYIDLILKTMKKLTILNSLSNKSN